jgi:uncharacterized protein YkwD
MRSFLVVLVALLLGACVSHYEPPKSGEPSGLDAANADQAWPATTVYTTALGSNGVRGANAKDAERLLTDELTERGDSAEPDATLATTADWVLRRAYAREESSASTIASAAQRFGFVGLVLGAVTGSVSEDTTRATLRDIVNQVPKNMPINRYGIVSGRGRDAVIVLGVVEASLEDFPRALAPGGTLRLKGAISERFEHAAVFATNPEGKIDELPLKGRDVDVTLDFPSTGVHQVELLGYGATGPVVLVNVPIEVGVSTNREAAARTVDDPNLTPEQAEAELLSLLDAERTKRGLGALAADSELRSVALAHSTDMSSHNFFGHVSPTTGGPEARVQAAGLRVSKFGECVALEMTPSRAFQGLMDSPAHRATMLDPSFTHVGIGVAFSTVNGQRRLHATLLFGRRPPPSDARLSADEALAIIQAARQAKNLPALEADPMLSAAAAAGARALTDGSAKDGQQVLAVAARELQRELYRRHARRGSCQLYGELIDRLELTTIPLLARPDIVAIGIGTAPLEGEQGPKLGFVLFADAGPGKGVDCN